MPRCREDPDVAPRRSHRAAGILVAHVRCTGPARMDANRGDGRGKRARERRARGGTPRSASRAAPALVGRHGRLPPVHARRRLRRVLGRRDLQGDRDAERAAQPGTESVAGRAACRSRTSSIPAIVVELKSSPYREAAAAAARERRRAEARQGHLLGRDRDRHRQGDGRGRQAARPRSSGRTRSRRSRRTIRRAPAASSA